MHDAWFSTGAPVPTGTVQCIFVVPPNTQTDPNADGAYIINPSTTVFTAQDIYQRTIPATTTLKIQVVQNGGVIDNPITNTSQYYTYTGPFTLIQALPSATVGPSYMMASRAFDTVTGPGIQTAEPQQWSTVPNNPDA
jgi:hypothetical protein